MLFVCRYQLLYIFGVFFAIFVLGRLALSDNEVTVAAGVVKDVRRTAQQLAGFDD